MLTANAAGEPVTFLYNPVLDDGRAFLPGTAGGLLRLAPVAGRPGYYRGRGVRLGLGLLRCRGVRTPRGAVLPRLAAFDVMWFAWYAFFPGTTVLA